MENMAMGNLNSQIWKEKCVQKEVKQDHVPLKMGMETGTTLWCTAQPNHQEGNEQNRFNKAITLQSHLMLRSLQPLILEMSVETASWSNFGSTSWLMMYEEPLITIAANLKQRVK